MGRRGGILCGGAVGEGVPYVSKRVICDKTYQHRLLYHYILSSVLQLPSNCKHGSCNISCLLDCSALPHSSLLSDPRPPTHPPPPCPFTCATTPLRLRSAPPLPIFDCLTPLQPLSSFACPLSSPPKPFLRLHQSDSLPCVGVQKQAGNPAARAQAQICSARWGRRGFPPFKCA